MNLNLLTIDKHLIIDVMCTFVSPIEAYYNMHSI